MTDISTIKADDIVNFDMITPGIFGDQYKGVIVNGLVSYAVAKRLDPSIDGKHANFYPFFKDSVDNVDDPNLYKYLTVQLDSTQSELLVFGVPWINKDSLAAIKSREATVVIRGFVEFHRAPLVDFLNSLNVPYTMKVDDK
jgi:hypothetical protein